jgi:acetate kinase
MTNQLSTKPTHTSILMINGGSSSIKFAMYQTGEPLKQRLHGKIDSIGLSGSNLTFSDSTGNQKDSLILESSDTKSAANFLIDWLKKRLISL